MSSERRAVLEGIAFGGDSTDMARLKALELLQHLDAREREWQPPTWTLEERVETEPDRIAKLVELAVAAGLFDEGIEAEVERRVAERLRERFGVVSEAGEGQAADEPTDESSAPSDDPSDAENVEQVTSRADSAVSEFSTEILARQWPGRSQPTLLASVLRRDGT